VGELRLCDLGHVKEFVCIALGSIEINLRRQVRLRVALLEHVCTPLQRTLACVSAASSAL